MCKFACPPLSHCLNLQNPKVDCDRTNRHASVVTSNERESEVTYQNRESNNELVLGQPSETFGESSETFAPTSEGFGEYLEISN